MLTTLLAHTVLLSRAQEVWKLKLDKEEIKIYTRPYTDSKIKALKVVCTVKATLSQIAAVLLDVKSQIMVLSYKKQRLMSGFSI